MNAEIPSSQTTETLLQRIRELHGMEAQIARSMVVLSGSVMNLRLRKLLSDRALCARNRRDRIAALLDRHHESTGAVLCPTIEEVFSGGDRLLAETGNPFQRDVIMAGHCLQIENLATTAYESCSRLANRAGFKADEKQFASCLSELENSSKHLRALESELSRIAANRRSLMSHEDADNRNATTSIKPELPQTPSPHHGPRYRTLFE